MATRMRPVVALSASLAILVSGCLSSTPPTGSPTEAPPPPPSPPSPAPSPALGPPPPGFVNVYVIEATLDVTRNDNLSTDLGVDPIRLPHCSFVYPEENNTKLRVEPSFDPNVTAVVLVRYIDRTSFSGGGDDTAVFRITGQANASIPAALNRSTPLYGFAPAESLFPPSQSSTNQSGGRFNSSYQVEGTLTLYPDFYPQETGVFMVNEWHTLVVRFVAELDLRGIGGCD